MKSFKQMIQGGEIKRADAMKIQYADLHIEPNFNLRDAIENLSAEERQAAEAEDESLFQHIVSGGQIPALEVRPREDGGVWVVDGHRRHAQIGRAIAAGTPIEWVNIVPFTGNDADRTARIITSQDNRKLRPIELARGVKRLFGFGLTPNEVAAKIGKSVQRVNQLLELANANTDVQKMVAAGGVSAAVATQVVREHGDNAGKVLAEAAERAKADGKTKVTPKTLAADKPKALPVKVAQELETAAWELSKHLDIPAHEVLEHGLRNGVASIAAKEVLVPAGFLLELVMAAQAANDARGNQHIRVLADQEKAKQQTLEAAA